MFVEVLCYRSFLEFFLEGLDRTPTPCGLVASGLQEAIQQFLQSSWFVGHRTSRKLPSAPLVSLLFTSPTAQKSTALMEARLSN